MAHRSRSSTTLWRAINATPDERPRGEHETCRECGAWLEFPTDGNGRVLEQCSDPRCSSHTPHLMMFDAKHLT